MHPLYFELLCLMSRCLSQIQTDMAENYQEKVMTGNAVFTNDERFRFKEIKQMIDEVQAMGIKNNKEEIFKVLQHHEYDVSSTVSAFIDNNGINILESWHSPVGYKSKRNKKKKPIGKKSRKDSVDVKINMINSTDGSFDPPGKSDMKFDKSNNPLNKTRFDDVTTVSDLAENAANLSIDCRSVNKLEKQLDRVKAYSVSKSSTKPEIKSDGHLASNESLKSAEDVGTFCTNHELFSQNDKNPPRKCERSMKSKTLPYSNKVIDSKDVQRTRSDLKRQSSALARVDQKLKAEIRDSHNRIRHVFSDIKASIQQREDELKVKMLKLEKDSSDLLSERMNILQKFQVKTGALPNMSVNEFKVYRQDVKAFIGDRALDAELGNSERFQYYKTDLDNLLKSIQSFGEVVPVTNKYSQRRLTSRTVSAETDDALSKDVPIPTSSPLMTNDSVPDVGNINLDSSASDLPTKKHDYHCNDEEGQHNQNKELERTRQSSRRSRFYRGKGHQKF